MERVQFQQEQMLAELKDLAQKGLFSQPEIKQIMRKRTAFETALIRRVAKKGDYLRYISYELNLEALRKKRVLRLNLPPGPPSVSDFALVKRQFHIFERALKKFKSDLALWIQYIHLAQKEGARSLVGRITARALQLHPNTPALYILAAQHELSHLSPSAARTLLQRGIRLNKESVDMWREYVRMELGFVESMRRRWDVLGIKLDEDDQVDMHTDKDDQDAARRAIMQGAIVKSVISNAVKAIPKADLFTSLHILVSTYPCPAPLKHSLLDHLHSLLQQTLPCDPQALKLSATRHLTSFTSFDSPEFIDVLRTANEELVNAVKKADQTKQREDLGSVYAEFVQEWCTKQINDSLKFYLISSLYALIQQTKHTIPPLLVTHLTLLLQFSSSSPPLNVERFPSPSRILKLAEKYTRTREVRENAEVWIARLEVESTLARRIDDVGGSEKDEKWMETWREARECVRGEGTVGVWVWGLQTESERKSEILQTLLRESLKTHSPSSPDLHQILLTHYISLQIQKITNGNSDVNRSEFGRRVKELVERIERDYFPSGNVWEEMFSKLEDLVSSSRKSTEKGSSSTPTNTLVTSISDNETESILGAVYTRWMKQCPVEATLGMAGWFLRNGKGGKCVEVLRCVRGKEEVEREVETRWRGVVREFEDQRGTKGKGRSDDEDEQENPNDEDEEMSVMQ